MLDWFRWMTQGSEDPCADASDELSDEELDLIDLEELDDDDE